MDANEAISKIRFMLDVGGSDGFTSSDKEALHMAINALSAEVTAQPKTNADCIRQMTDEEELLSAIGTSCYRCIYSNGQCDSGYGEGCIAGNLEWLRKEAEDAGTD